MEFYVSAFPVPTAMWVKRSNVQTFQGAIDEVVKFENEMISLTACHYTTKVKKASQSYKKSSGSGNKVAETKEKDATDVEGLHRIIKKLTNTVIDMKRNVGESTSGNGGDYNNKKPFKPFYRKKIEGGHGQLAFPAPPNEGALNTEELALIGPILNKEEYILQIALEQGDEDEYQVEEHLKEETKINVLWDFHSNENDNKGDNTAENNANKIHMQSKGMFPGATKPIDQTKQEVRLVKTSSPEVYV